MPLSTAWTTGASKSLLTACPSGMEPSLQSTRPSCRPSRVVARSRRDLARPVALLDARCQKERTYPELLRSSRCRLVVLGVEVGGRWSSETADFLRQPARAKAKDTPATLHVAYQATLDRWSGFLTAAAMQAFAASLSALPSAGFLRPLSVTGLATALLASRLSAHA